MIQTDPKGKRQRQKAAEDVQSDQTIEIGAAPDAR
jgi:hypothetical protein